MPKIATLDDYKVTTAHGKLLYNIGKKNNLTIQDLAKELSCSVVYIRSILKGDFILSSDKSMLLRKKYERENIWNG